MDTPFEWNHLSLRNNVAMGSKSFQQVVRRGEVQKECNRSGNGRQPALKERLSYNIKLQGWSNRVKVLDGMWH